MGFSSIWLSKDICTQAYKRTEPRGFGVFNKKAVINDRQRQGRTGLRPHSVLKKGRHRGETVFDRYFIVEKLAYQMPDVNEGRPFVPYPQLIDIILFLHQ
jgi:hypothetical protein